MKGRVCQQGTTQMTRRENETSILCSVVSRGEDVFIYKLLVSNYLRRLEACRAGFQACAECNPYTSRGVEILTIPGQSLLQAKIFLILLPPPLYSIRLLLQLLIYSCNFYFDSFFFGLVFVSKDENVGLGRGLQTVVLTRRHQVLWGDTSRLEYDTVRSSSCF